MEKLLEVNNLTKVFTMGGILSRVKLTATDNVSFYIRPGEVFTLAGESGCGKTTTAKIILGFEDPTSGTIIHNGKNRAETKSKRVWQEEGIQAIFQDPFGTFNPLRVVDRYFFETLHQFKMAANKREAIELMDETLRLVGLTYEEFAGKYPSEFSGGQLQRISVARALLTKPDLLIADEPVSMVDASLRMSIVNLFKRLKEEANLGVLYITHDLATAYYVSERIAIMFRGHIVEMGPVEKVLMEPKHPYSQLLRESIPQADPTKRWDKRIRLGETEEEEYLRVGCKFAGRCPQVMPICKEQAPLDIDIDGVLVKCHLYNGSVKA
jgi:peptide/nickel transport system ATP-binding protein